MQLIKKGIFFLMKVEKNIALNLNACGSRFTFIYQHFQSFVCALSRNLKKTFFFSFQSSDCA